MGKGGGGGETSLTRELAGASREQRTAFAPLQGMLLKQGGTGLRTGGIGARIPDIQRAVEAARMSQAQGLRTLDTQLAQGGLAGTPFGAAARGEAGRQAEFVTSQVGPQLIQERINQALSLIGAQGGQGLAGLGQAASLSSQQAIAAQAAQAQQSAGIGAGLGGAAVGIGTIVAVL